MPAVNRAFAPLAIAVMAAFLLPGLAQDGMFMDGMLYAVVAHNEALGFGTFWEPRFSQLGVAGLSAFHEHPPLGFGLQALWFMAFGSAFWVERLYQLGAAVLMAWLLVLTYRALLPAAREARRYWWWPLLLWVVVPVIHWSYHNNMLETTMGLFTTAAVLAVVRAHDGRWWARHAWAGALVFLASMTKGLPGLFPLAAPVLLALALRRRLPEALGASVLMTAVVAFLYGALMLLPEARESLMTYVEKRLLHRIAVKPTVDSRFATLEMLFTTMLAPLALALAVRFGGRKAAERDAAAMRGALGMALIGLSGVAPLMLTLVQKSFYMGAALPLLSVALAVLAAPSLERLMSRALERPRLIAGVRIAGWSLTAGAVVAAALLFGRPARDADMLADVALVGALVPRGALIGAEEPLWEEWNLQGYLMRRHSISIDCRTTGRTWYLGRAGSRPPQHERYQPVPLPFRSYALWKQVLPLEGGAVAAR